jgi:hypothetical protein
MGITKLLLLGILAIPPGHTGNYLGIAGVENFGTTGLAAGSFSDHDFANGSAISVFLAPFDGYLTSKYQ